jgi:beta-aspartyl-peptidase (threonine type)
VEASIAIHGGAGTIPVAALGSDIADEYHASLRRALQTGWGVLAKAGRALDAVTAAVMVLEDDPLFNAARGAVLTSAGRLEMDSGVMSGRERDAGAVAGICGPRNPILAPKIFCAARALRSSRRNIS